MPKATLKNMRASVTGWLTEEKATQEQALMLLDALYSGTIRGIAYQGARDASRIGPVQIDRFVKETRDRVADSTYGIYEDGCGCLLHTMDQIIRQEDHRLMTSPVEPNTPAAIVFILAANIGFGETPENNKWALAAAEGIEDYLCTLPEGM